MSETGIVQRAQGIVQLDQWNSIKNDYICIEEKMNVTKDLYDLYLDQGSEQDKIQNENKQYILSLLDEYKELKKQISSPLTDEATGIKALDLNSEETEQYSGKCIESEKELQELEQKNESIKNLKEIHKKFTKQADKDNLLAIQTKSRMNKYKMFAKVDLNQAQLINSKIHSSDSIQSDHILLNKYYIHELLTGIEIIERMPFENREMFEQMNGAEKPWFDILFTNLSDDCLDFDANLEKYPVQLKNNLSQLSNSLVEFYKSIFRKRKTTKCTISMKINNCVFLNNLDDFKIFSNNSLPLICMSLTEQEVETAMKQFAIEWVKGSLVINILINSSSSKMATIVLPKFYPLTGTNQIKLIRLTRHEDKDIQKFSIAENSGTLYEWIGVFTEMYNSNSIV